MPFLNSLLVDIVVVCLTLYAIKRIYSAKPVPNLPPGPKPLPLIGNLLDIPTEYQHLTYTKWADIWGDIVSASVLGQRIVVLNTVEAAIDLLEKKSSIYSDRPYMHVAGEVLGWDQTLVLSQPRSDRFREIRRLMFKSLGGRGQADKMDAHRNVEEEETHQFLRLLLESPENFASHIRQTAGAVILRISYGYTIRRDGVDDLVDLIDRAVDGFVASSTPGSFLVDNFPLLKYVPPWVPGTGWKVKVKKWQEETAACCNVPFEMAKNAALSGTNTSDNFISVNMDNIQVSESEEHLKMAAATMYSGGADTTVSAIHAFFLAMTLYPEVQRKAQAELDRVIGNDRLPSFDDCPSLPYIHALCSEVLRWLPVAPSGVAHKAAQDGTYKDYFIPKGSIVIANNWKILHDPEVYHDPMVFNPDRFIEKDGQPAEQDPRCAAFGFGKRICPGLNLGESSIFISSAMTLAVFDISKAVDENGLTITPPAEHTPGTISHPKPFVCSIKPRSAKAEAIIRAHGSS